MFEYVCMFVCVCMCVWVYVYVCVGGYVCVAVGGEGVWLCMCVCVCVCKCELCSVQCALLFSAIDHNPRKLCIWLTVQCSTLTFCPVIYAHSRTCIQNTIPY